MGHSSIRPLPLLTQYMQLPYVWQGLQLTRVAVQLLSGQIKQIMHTAELAAPVHPGHLPCRAGIRRPLATGRPHLGVLRRHCQEGLQAGCIQAGHWMRVASERILLQVLSVDLPCNPHSHAWQPLAACWHSSSIWRMKTGSGRRAALL